jgi:hypothetical protein
MEGEVWRYESEGKLEASSRLREQMVLLKVAFIFYFSIIIFIAIFLLE